MPFAASPVSKNRDGEKRIGFLRLKTKFPARNTQDILPDLDPSGQTVIGARIVEKRDLLFEGRGDGAPPAAAIPVSF
jgi:hypothetical protein